MVSSLSTQINEISACLAGVFKNLEKPYASSGIESGSTSPRSSNKHLTPKLN